MTETRSYIHSEKSVTEKNRENRISLISKICQVFRFGFEEEALTFRELKEACEFVSTLIGSIDRDAKDLCLLASHAENVEQFIPICKMSQQRWRKKVKRHTKEWTVMPY